VAPRQRRGRQGDAPRRLSMTLEQFRDAMRALLRAAFESGQALLGVPEQDAYTSPLTLDSGVTPQSVALRMLVYRLTATFMVYCPPARMGPPWMRRHYTVRMPHIRITVSDASAALWEGGDARARRRPRPPLSRARRPRPVAGRAAAPPRPRPPSFSQSCGPRQRCARRRPSRTYRERLELQAGQAQQQRAAAGGAAAAVRPSGERRVWGPAALAQPPLSDRPPHASSGGAQSRTPQQHAESTSLAAASDAPPAGRDVRAAAGLAPLASPDVALLRVPRARQGIAGAWRGWRATSRSTSSAHGGAAASSWQSPSPHPGPLLLLPLACGRPTRAPGETAPSARLPLASPSAARASPASRAGRLAAAAAAAASQLAGLPPAVLRGTLRGPARAPLLAQRRRGQRGRRRPGPPCLPLLLLELPDPLAVAAHGGPQTLHSGPTPSTALLLPPPPAAPPAQQQQQQERQQRWWPGVPRP